MLLSGRSKILLDNIDLKSNQAIVLVNDDIEYLKSVYKDVASRALEISVDKLQDYPYITKIETTKSSLGVDEVRDLESKLSLAIPSRKLINRIVIIEQGNIITVSAQQSLLKNIEETPKGTLIIILISSLNKLLPTIRSRTRNIEILKPNINEAVSYYSNFDKKEVEQNYLISEGNPLVLDALLNKTNIAVNDQLKLAKQIISMEKIDRISLINDLIEDKIKLIETINIVKQMAKIGINSDNKAQAKHWMIILEESIKLIDRLTANSYNKLALLDFLLAF